MIERNTQSQVCRLMIFAATFQVASLSGTANARNWPGLILMTPDMRYRAAIWAQEAFEATAKLNPLVLFSFPFRKKLRQDLEVCGQAMEIAAAERIYFVDTNRYRRQQARDLVRLYKDFEGMSEKHVESWLEDMHAPAKEWVEKHLKRILKHTAEG